MFTSFLRVLTFGEFQLPPSLWVNEQLANMFPVTPLLCSCLGWLVTDRGGEEADSVIRWQIDIDRLWGKVTENEGDTGKAKQTEPL